MHVHFVLFAAGYRNISNQLTIRTKIDKMSEGLKDLALNKGWWKPDHEFDFAKIFSSNFEETELKTGARPCGRQLWGTHLLQQYSEGGKINFCVKFMKPVTSPLYCRCTVHLSQNAPQYAQMTAIKRNGRFQTLSVSSITSKKCHSNYYACTR